jgi:hypothetical protein
VVRKGRIDYRMRRIAALRDVREGITSPADVCDAHPDLLRAARHLGRVTNQACPLCEDEQISHVSYVFERKGARSTPGGRAVPHDALAAQAERFGELSVYVVEVCLGCAWHHLIESYLLLANDTDASHG